MFGFYLVLGFLIIFWKDIPFELSKSVRIPFGILIIVYSFFRFVRLMQMRKD